MSSSPHRTLSQLVALFAVLAAVAALSALVFASVAVAQEGQEEQETPTNDGSPAVPPGDLDNLRLGDPIPEDDLYPEPSEDQSSHDSVEGGESLKVDQPVPNKVSPRSDDGPSLAPAPTGFYWDGFSDTTLTFVWNYTPDVHTYRVTYRQSGNTTWLLAGYLTVSSNHDTSTDHEYTKTGLTPSTTYEFRVASRGDGDPYTTTYGNPTLFRTATTDQTRAGPPSSVTTGTRTSTSIVVSWNSVDNAFKYLIEYQKSGEETWRHGGFTAATTSSRVSTTITGLTSCTSYKFRVRTRFKNRDGFSNLYGRPSSARTGSTIGCIIIPPPITNSRPSFLASETGGRSVQDGSASDTAVGSPFVATDPNQNDELTFTLSGDDHTSFTIETTKVNNTYHGQLKTNVAMDHANKSSYSLTVGVSDSKDQYGNVNTAVDDIQDVNVQVQLPNVTLISGALPAVFGEGEDVTYTLVFNPMPIKKAITVTIDLYDEPEGGWIDTVPLLSRSWCNRAGAPIFMFIRCELSVVVGSNTATLTVGTRDDRVDKTDGYVIANLQAGTGYVAASTAAVRVRVEDDDLAKPLNLEIDGHITGPPRTIPLTFDSVSEAESYNVRYAEEVCVEDLSATLYVATNGDEYREHDCNIDDLDGDGLFEESEYTYINDVQPSVSGSETKLTISTPALQKTDTTSTLFRVEVQAQADDRDDSPWWDFALVYPTSTPITKESTLVGTFPVDLYQPDGVYEYQVCAPAPALPPIAQRSGVAGRPRPVPGGHSGQEVVDLIERWDLSMPAGVPFDTRGTSNANCQFKDPETVNHIVFLGEDDYNMECGLESDGCWKGRTNLAAPVIPQAVRVRAKLSASGWPCSRAGEVVLHEVGHALGIGHGEIYDGIMSYGPIGNSSLCWPSRYDIAAVTANYQSGRSN